MLGKEAAAKWGRVGTFGLSWPLLCALFAAAWVLYGQPFDKKILSDADTYWHIAAGRWMLENGTILSADPFSHSLPGTHWTAHEWLAEVLLAGTYRAGGWGGVVVLVAILFAGTMGYLARFLLERMEPVYALLFTVFAAAMLSGHLLARPHALVWPLLAVWVGALVTAGERGDGPPLKVLPLMTLWANLHGSFTLGLALAAVLACDAVLRSPEYSRRVAIGRWSGFVGLAVAAAMLTPWGGRGLWFPFELMGMSFAPKIIGEWRSPDFQKFQLLEVWLMLMLALGWTGRGRVPWLRLIVILGLAHLALKHQRHISVLGLTVPFFLASPLAAHWRATKVSGQNVEALDRFFVALAAPARRGAVVGSALIMAVLAAGVFLSPRFLPAAARTPDAAVQAVVEAGVGGRVLNSYNFGGYLIFKGVPVFIDGRADMYGDRFLKRFMEAVQLHNGDSLPELLSEYRISWTLFEPKTPVLAVLDRLPGWKRIYADEVAVVHVREGNSAAASGASK